MLKNVLIPEKIGNYFIFPQKILGFEINKSYINAIKITVSEKRKTVIDKFYEEFIVSNNNSYIDKSSNFIKRIIENNKDNNVIKIALPSYLVIYKELTFPFTDIGKIKSILDFEIEPTIPFSINEAVLDFIITKQNLKTRETTILVAIARKKDIQELIEPFRNIGIAPNKIIVDVIGLYGLIESSIPISETLVLIDIEFNSTNILYIQNQQLRIIRSIQQGTSQIIKNVVEDSDLNEKQAWKYLIEESNYNQDDQNKSNKYTSDLITNIEFTLNSFKTLITNFTEIQKIIILGPGSQINNINEYFKKKLNIPCAQLDINSIVKNNNFINKEKNLPNSSLISLAIAYPSQSNESFNLLRKEFEPKQKNLFFKQIFLFTLLSLLIIIFTFTLSQLRTKKLKNELNISKNEIINILKTRFEITDPIILRNLTEVINTANNKVNAQEAIWGAFSKKTKFSFLKYLAELSKIIDRQAIGLNLKSLSIKDGIITLEGEVKDFKALEIFENELNESKLFSHVSVPQETSFIIKITVKKNED